MKKYHENSKRAQDFIALAQWQAHCAKQQVPWVVLETGSKYADACLRLDTYAPDVLAYIHANRERIFAGIEDVYKRHRTQGSRLRSDYPNFLMKSLEIEQARHAANEVSDWIGNTVLNYTQHARFTRQEVHIADHSVV